MSRKSSFIIAALSFLHCLMALHVGAVLAGSGANAVFAEKSVHDNKYWTHHIVVVGKP